MGLGRWIGMGAVLALMGGCAVIGDFASDEPGLREGPGVFDSRFLAVSDTDITATAYADGALEPVPGAEDTLTLLASGEVVATAAASNSVISWPQVLDVSPDGRFAVVVETRGRAPDGVVAMDSVYTDFPIGQAVSVFEIGENGLRRTGIGDNLQAVDIAPNG